jgi:hypothetical protein
VTAAKVSVVRRPNERLWLIAHDGELQVSRMLVDEPSGELLDHAWRDDERCTRSWSAPRTLDGPRGAVLKIAPAQTCPGAAGTARGRHRR